MLSDYIIVDCHFQFGVLFSFDVYCGSTVHASVYAVFESRSVNFLVSEKMKLPEEGKVMKSKKDWNIFQMAFHLVKSDLSV